MELTALRNANAKTMQLVIEGQGLALVPVVGLVNFVTSLVLRVCGVASVLFLVLVSMVHCATP